MEMPAFVQRQRLSHIVESYTLAGEEPAAFETRLDALATEHPAALIELAMVECLVNGWLRFPLVRGLAFLAEVEARLHAWKSDPITSFVSPLQFATITGLDPSPVFGPEAAALGTAIQSG